MKSKERFIIKKRIINLILALVLINLVLYVPVMASSDADGKIYAANTYAVDVTVPSTRFYWYADSTTQNSGSTYDIISGNYKITNNSPEVNVEVEVTDFIHTSSSTSANPVSESDVTLNLTGDLAADGYGQDIFNGAPTWGTCSELLASTNGVTANLGKKEWVFGFNGTYNNTSLPVNAELTDYTLIIELTAHSISYRSLWLQSN